MLCSIHCHASPCPPLTSSARAPSLQQNLPYRILAFNLRGLDTALRRLVSAMILFAFLLISFITILSVNSLKEDLRTQLRNGASIPADLLTYVDQGFPIVASVVVVAVNVAIGVIVSVLGKYSRHPTLSAMHKNKVSTILWSTVFNTGVLPVIVSMAPPPRAYIGAYQQACTETCDASSVFCLRGDGPLFCLFGPTGVLARGNYFTMSTGWYKDVGVLMVTALFFQTVSACTAWSVPWIASTIKRKLKAGSVMHRYDMEALYAGPPIDLPQFIGKAYAFFFVTLMYASVMPVLYIIGTVFFFGVFLVERFALLRVHQTPPPYSHELILDTLWWMPWLVCIHLGLSFWGYASLPAAPIGSGPYAAPFGNATLDSLIAEAAEQGSGGAATPATALLGAVSGATAATAAATAAAGEAVGALEYLYDFGGHAGASVATLLLFVPALLILLVLLTLALIPDFVEATIKDVFSRMCCKKNAVRVLPAANQLRPPSRSRPPSTPRSGACSRVDAPAGAEGTWEVNDGAPGAEPITTSLEGLVVNDPPYSQVLEGVHRDNVRTHNGTIVHEAQLSLQRGRYATLYSFMPVPLLFRVLGLANKDAPITTEQWEKATPVFTRLTRAADISYQPEFHPTFETAFVFLAHPEKLSLFLEAESQQAAAAARAKALLAAQDSDDDEEDEAPKTKEKQADGDEEGSDDDEAMPSILCAIQ